MRAFFVIVILCCCALVAQAQPTGPGFFDKNFANSPLEDTHQTERHDERVVQPSPAPVSAEAVSTRGFVELGPTATVVPTVDPNDPFGRRVYAIGAVINAHNAKHFRSNVNQLVQVCRDRNLSIARIYAVGSLTQYGSAIEPFLTNDWRMLSTLEFINRIAVSPRPPAEYATLRSPSWLFATSQGIVVAEGYTNLDSLLTKNGVLKDLSAEEQVTPLASPVATVITKE